EYGDYCLELQAARQNRFAHLPGGGMNYAYHLDAGKYARFLRRYAEGFGARRVEGRIARVATDAGTGHVASLRLEDGTEIEGDLFIDCTGFRALLIGQTMKEEYEDWSHWLFCDSALAVQTASQGELVPYTRAIAHGAGWQWRIPLQSRVGNGLVYASGHIADEQARQVLLSNLQGEPLTDPRVIRFKPGQRRRTWSGNVVAVGLSSGFLEPIESTSIHLISRSLIRLMQLFPTYGIRQSDVDEFNAQSAREIAHIRDFIILHYHVTNRRDTPFWRACAEMDIPASLRHRIALFRETGRVFRQPDELFVENSWIQVMLGQGVHPEQHHQSAELMGDAELAGFLGQIRTSIDQAVRRMPLHRDYVRRYCGT
ncbi:MAG: tryptophan halogenase family protein, partial [Telluria sp.]